MRRFRSVGQCFAVVLVLAVLATACASTTPFRVSGELLDKAGSVFLMTARAYDAALDQKLVTPTQYNAWKAFGVQFQQSYRPAVTAWKAARAANDAAKEQTVQAQIDGLLVVLAQYGTVIGLQISDILNGKTGIK